MSPQPTATLTVADAYNDDATRDDIVRVDPDVVTDLQLVPGDRVQITTEDATSITKEVWRVGPDDDATGVIRMTLGTRAALGVDTGDTVTLAPRDT